MVITFAFDGLANRRAGFYRSRNCIRVWWMWFAVAYYWRDEQWLVCEAHGWAAPRARKADHR